MRKLLKIELSRALKNKFLLYAVLLGTIITVWHFVQNVVPLANTLDECMNLSVKLNDPMMHPGWLFSAWIGGNLHDMQGFLYYLLLPILAAIPFSASFFLDKKNGYIKNVFVRAKKRDYYISKFIATFIAGGIAVAVPLLINLALTATLLPSMLPQVTSSRFYVNATNMWCDLFYTHPYLYVFSYLILDFVFSGLIATIALVVGSISEYKFVVLIAPFLVYLFVFSIFNLLGMPIYAPFEFLQPCCNPSSFIVVLIETLILGISTASIFCIKGTRDDTY